ncbi:MAG TPA: hypothetical protein VFI27_23005 [candidate division Zixibacteria bacterium]|nr:hypothetical protein [candidate division Zixibacteria bacterium]
MSNEQLMALLLAKPEPSQLWQLRSAMLEVGLSSDDKRLEIVNELYEFVNVLVAKSTARQYSHFASILDLGAVGGVALQNLLEMSDSKKFTQRLLAGGLSEVLMVMAARQYVKAWEVELKSTYAAAAWRLYAKFWYLSVASQPDMESEKRRLLVDGLIAPLRDAEASGTVKAAIIIHYYQLLLLAHLEISV